MMDDTGYIEILPNVVPSVLDEAELTNDEEKPASLEEADLTDDEAKRNQEAWILCGKCIEGIAW